MTLEQSEKPIIANVKITDELFVDIDLISFSENSGQISCRVTGQKTKIAYLNWTVRDVHNTSLEIVDFLIYNKLNRQKGIGSILINVFKKIAANKGISRIWGNTSFDDYQLHEFYKKHAFIFSKEIKGGGIDFYQDLAGHNK